MLKIKIDNSIAIPIYQQIVNQVKRLIHDEQLKPGDQIPSVRELAKWLQLNPSTVARAYFDLKMENIVMTSRRRGTIIVGNGFNDSKDARQDIPFNGEKKDSLLNALIHSPGLNDVETCFTIHQCQWQVQRVV